MPVDENGVLVEIEIATMMRFTITAPRIVFDAMPEVGESREWIEAGLEVLRAIRLTGPIEDLRSKRGHLLLQVREQARGRGRIEASFYRHKDRYSVVLMLSLEEYRSVERMLFQPLGDKVLEIEFNVRYGDWIESLDGEWGSLSWDDAAYPELPIDSFQIYSGGRWIGDRLVEGMA